MKKVIVIGCPGSGKSTFAKALHEKTALPLYHLDMMYWNPDRTHLPKEEFRGKLRQLLTEETWIIDGNYNSTMEERIKACDTVIFLDYPVEVCISGVLERRGKVRTDMAWTEAENEIDEEFLAFIRSYNGESRPNVLKLLEQYSEKRSIIFHSREEAAEYLNSL